MRVTSKGQVTIPKHVRDLLGIEPGSEVDFVRVSDGVRLVAVEGDLSGDEGMRRFEEALDRMAGTFDTGGPDGKTYIDWLRGPSEDLDVD